MIGRLVRFWSSLSWTVVLIGFGLIFGLALIAGVFREKISAWMVDFWRALTLTQVLVFLGLFLVSLALSFAAIAIVMVKIPANYFSSHYVQDFMPGSHWTVRWGAVIVKNVLGVFLIALGIVLSLPGIPGQGILTILLGLIMIDIPGKRPLEAKIIQRPTVLAAVNKLRARYGKPDLIMD